MSQMNEMDACLNALKSAADSLRSVAESLMELFSSNQVEAMQQPEADPVPQSFTKELVRAVLAQKSTSGFGKEVRALLKAYNVSQLSDVNPEDYADLMQAAQTIGLTEVQEDAR